MFVCVIIKMLMAGVPAGKGRDMRHYNIGIIGAGASGMMAAIAAKEENPLCSICIAERNPDAGKKLLATGNGRCNYLNKNAGPGRYFSRGGNADEFTGKLFEAISVDTLIEKFRALGIEPFEEAEGRLYPRSLQAASVVNALEIGIKKSGAELLLSFYAKDVKKTQAGFEVTAEDGRAFSCDKLILTTGGKGGISYGSSGDGYKFAMNMGCKAVKPIPALTKLVALENLQPLFGVRVNGRIRLLKKCGAEAARCCAADSGEIQFTNEWISGICTMNISRFYEIEENTKYEVEIDFFEDIPEEKLLEMLKSRKESLREERAEMFFNGLLPEKLGVYLLSRAGITDRRAQIASFDDELIKTIAALCKGLKFGIVGTAGWKDTVSTAGGMAIDRVDVNTMESKDVPGLFFAGEILDIDALCGGYSLSFAFASGLTAGLAAAK